MSSLKKVEKDKHNKYRGKMECPDCKSMNTEADNKMASVSIIFIILCFLGFCMSLWIPVLGWIAAPGFLLVGAISIITLILSSFTKTYTLTCKDCNVKYTIDKKEYNELVKNK